MLVLTIVGKNAVLAIPDLKLMPAAGRATTRTAVLVAYYVIQLGVISFLAARHGSSILRAFGLRKPSPAQTPARPAEKPSVAISGLLVIGLLVGVEVVAIVYGLSVQALGWRQPLTLATDVASVFGVGAVALGWLTWNRRSLWPSLVLHVLYNGLAVAAAFWVPK